MGASGSCKPPLFRARRTWVWRMVRRHFMGSIVLLSCFGFVCEPMMKDGVRRLSAEARVECVAQGGKVARILVGAEGCVRPSTDGGK